ncbi:MAG: hypothetical protein KH611_08875 [Clostridium sp.]|nr:hypothetical protein [Clostridium sp.]
MKKFDLYIRFLKEKNPDVYTADEEILDDNDYLDVWGKFNGKKFHMSSRSLSCTCFCG